MITTETLLSVQTQIHDQHGIRTDVHYVEGKGALIVREGAALTPENVIMTIPDAGAWFHW